MEDGTIKADLARLWRDLLNRLGRKGLIAVVLFIFLSAGIFAGWKTGFLGRLYWSWNQAEAWVLVQNKGDVKPLVGVEVTSDGQTVETNENGMAHFENLPAREVIFIVSIPGFEDFSQTVKLKRGLNLGIVLELEVASGDIRGVVLDFVDGGPIEGAQITALGATATTGSDGVFVLEGVIVGTQEVSVAKSGYYGFSASAELVKGVQLDLGTIKLVGRGRVVFTSSREGGVDAIYWARFDGSQLEKLVPNVAGLPDYNPILSPLKGKLVFRSGRDSQKDAYGGTVDLPYYYNIATEELKKLSSDINYNLEGWLQDESGFVYQTYEPGELKIVRFPSLEVAVLSRTADFGSDVYFGRVALSPKSDWIAFSVEVYYPYSSAEKSGVYLIHPDGTGLKQIASVSSWSYLGFSRDGSELRYSNDATNKYYSYNLANGSISEISEPSDTCIPYYGYLDCPEERFSDAQNLKAYTSYRDGRTDLYVAGTDGSNERRITNTGGVEDFYFAGPNDRYLAYWYWAYGTEASELYLIGVREGSIPVKVTDISGLVGVISE